MAYGVFQKVLEQWNEKMSLFWYKNVLKSMHLFFNKFFMNMFEEPSSTWISIFPSKNNKLMF